MRFKEVIKAHHDKLISEEKPTANRFKIILIWVCCFAVSSLDGRAPLYKYDIAIVNGMVISGDGSRTFAADIGIKDGKIKQLGNIPKNEAEKVINAAGLYICPGFIDIHTHVDDKIWEIPTADNFLLQGVTTVISGNCGSSVYPISKLFMGIYKKGSSVNFGSFVGHNTVRARIMGQKKGIPSPYELRRMRAMIAGEMEAGALGLSTGLTYNPGVYSQTDELIDLARVLKKYGGLYASHMRNEGSGVAEAVKEAIKVGEEAGVRVQISHIKLFDESVWGQTYLISRQIENARRRGVEITTDQYPYTASSASFFSGLPQWARIALRRSSSSSDSLKRLRRGYVRMFERGTDKFYIARYRPRPQYEGKNFSQILLMLERDDTPVNAAELLIEILRRGDAQGIFFLMQEKDVESLMQLRYNMIGSDGTLVKYGEGMPHSRSYGTFPRIIARYVKEKKILSLEEAVRKMTSLPAHTLKYFARGLIRKRYWADLVIFDLALIEDTSTFADPHQYPRGIHYVLVNGAIAAQDGKPTGALAGRVLLGPGNRAVYAER